MKLYNIKDFNFRSSVARPFPVRDGLCQKAGLLMTFFTTKPAGQGTGLGLSMSYDIIKAHGGEIRVETREEGTEFIILLPVNSNT